MAAAGDPGLSRLRGPEHAGPGPAAGIGERFGLQKRLVAVRGCRTINKASMVLNDYAPHMDIDAQTYAVRADGLLLTCEPASVLPMAQRYFLF